MSNLRVIDGVDANPNIVKLCEDMLAAAKAGKIQGLAGMAVSTSGNCQVYLHPGAEDGYALSLLGGLDMVKMALIENYLQVPIAE